MRATQPQSAKTGHEESKLPAKPILYVLAGFAVCMLAIHLLVVGYGHILADRQREFGRVAQIQPDQIPRYPAPGLQVNPQVDLQEYRSRSENDLNSYGWIDSARGVTKIPIESAMNLLLSRGLPVRPAGPAGPTELDMQRQKAAADSSKNSNQPTESSQP